MAKKTVAELMRDAEAKLNESLGLAKAAQADEDGEPGSDLDSDYDELDQATEDSDAAEEQDPAGDEDEGEGDTDATPAADTDDSDEADEEEGEEGPGGVMAKAGDGFLDATELLTTIAGHLTNINAHMEHQNAEVAHLRRENRTLAKAVQAQSQGVLLMAKAQQTVGGLPVLPPSRQAKQAARVAVPTGVQAPPAGAPAADNATRATKIMAKAQQLATDGTIPAQAVALYHEMFRSMPVDAALQLMTTDEQTMFAGI